MQVCNCREAPSFSCVADMVNESSIEGTWSARKDQARKCYLSHRECTRDRSCIILMETTICWTLDASRSEENL